MLLTVGGGAGKLLYCKCQVLDSGVAWFRMQNPIQLSSMDARNAAVHGCMMQPYVQCNMDVRWSHTIREYTFPDLEKGIHDSPPPPPICRMQHTSHRHSCISTGKFDRIGPLSRTESYPLGHVSRVCFIFCLPVNILASLCHHCYPFVSL